MVYCDVLQSIYGAFDPDQSRTEDAMADEALTNKEESREALSFLGRLVVIPLVTGALISRAITDPVLSFSLQVTRVGGRVYVLLLFLVSSGWAGGWH